VDVICSYYLFLCVFIGGLLLDAFFSCVSCVVLVIGFTAIVPAHYNKLFLLLFVITFMQYIYSLVPETRNVSRVYSVAGIL
jgi:hypothetical protein